MARAKKRYVVEAGKNAVSTHTKLSTARSAAIRYAQSHYPGIKTVSVTEVSSQGARTVYEWKA